jgi:hypothetical protein
MTSGGWIISQSISSHGLGEAHGSLFFRPDGKKQPVVSPVRRFPPDLGLHPSPGPSRRAWGLRTREKQERGLLYQ